MKLSFGSACAVLCKNRTVPYKRMFSETQTNFHQFQSSSKRKTYSKLQSPSLCRRQDNKDNLTVTIPEARVANSSSAYKKHATLHPLKLNISLETRNHVHKLLSKSFSSFRLSSCMRPMDAMMV